MPFSPKRKYVSPYERPGYKSPFAKPMSEKEKNELRDKVIKSLYRNHKVMKYMKKAKEIKKRGDKRPLDHIIADLSLEDMQRRK
jgi:hypothetical protein